MPIVPRITGSTTLVDKRDRALLILVPVYPLALDLAVVDAQRLLELLSAHYFRQLVRVVCDSSMDPRDPDQLLLGTPFAAPGRLRDRVESVIPDLSPPDRR